MFDIGTKIKHARNTVWKYKVLWIFGFLLVLFGGGMVSGGGSNSGYRFGQNRMYNYNFNPRNFPMQLPYNAPAWLHNFVTFLQDKVVPVFTPDRIVSTVIWIFVILFGICLVVGLITALVRYPAETAIVRLVDEYEENGSTKKFKEGWKLGWNLRAFRIWVIDLIIGAPAFVVFTGLAVGSIVFVLNMTQGDMIRRIPGIVGLTLLAGFLFLVLAVVMIFVGLWRQFIIRAIAIDDAHIGEAFKKGWAMLAHHFKNAFLTWLVMLAFRIGFGILMMLAVLILIPAFVVLTLPGVVVAAIPGAIAFGIASIFTSGFWVWIIAALVAIPFFCLIVASPVTLLGGIFSLIGSSIWTQTYREMKNAHLSPPVLRMDEMEQPPTIL
jgi:hypothetical protein